MCRIRQKGEQYKITVKTKNENNDNVENHYFLTTNEGKEMIKNGMDGKYANTSSFLSNVATLKTERVSFPYENYFLTNQPTVKLQIMKLNMKL